MDSTSRTVADRDIPRVLFLGPLPPPTGGYVSLFLNVLDAWKARAGDTYAVINTSPGRIKSHPGIGSVQDIFRGVQIAAKLSARARDHDAVVFVATTGLFQRLMPVIGRVRRRNDAAFFLWFSGGVVHDVIAQMPPARRQRLVAGLNGLAGVVVETQQAYDGLRAQGVERVTAIPNPRVIDWEALPAPRAASAQEGTLRLVFFSRIVEDKGIYVLIDAVRRAAEEGVAVALDIYGPVDPDEEARFTKACAAPGVAYRGHHHGDATTLLAGYDAVALPTWFPREGHPGVIVEAMMAGVPVLTTRHMALPELVTDRENGLLVPPQDTDALTDAIRYLAEHPDRRFAMGAAHRARLARHDAAGAAGKLLELIGPKQPEHAPSLA